MNPPKHETTATTTTDIMADAELTKEHGILVYQVVKNRTPVEQREDHAKQRAKVEATLGGIDKDAALTQEQQKLIAQIKSDAKRQNQEGKLKRQALQRAKAEARQTLGFEQDAELTTFQMQLVSQLAQGRCLGRPCRLIPHPSLVQNLVCRDCNYVKHCKKVLYYNKTRRKFRMKENLRSLVCPMSAPSEMVLQKIRGTHGVYTNTGTTHVTFAEGLPPEGESQRKPLISQLAQVLHNTPLQVTGLNAIPTHNDKTKSLILINLKLDEHSDRALAPLLQACRLPQYPLHCTLGVLDTEKAMDLQQRWSRPDDGALTLDVRLLHELMPILQPRTPSQQHLLQAQQVAMAELLKP
ncbi:expressed unknown protein [Seminavis robusta]|uniref:Uncharacterized protein n=1 Tax=Seminavis robusta TaxID=568900 RepID=A0A9N8ER83_9STRA|nr:expressed unknown protein [Seminavis robusta]|eukprot:Sro1441_g272940.1 n/a (353) ;mRNA; r:15317-16375